MNYFFPRNKEEQKEQPKLKLEGNHQYEEFENENSPGRENDDKDLGASSSSRAI